MPIYEYVCMECESHFEELVRSSEQAVTCPECGARVDQSTASFAEHPTCTYCAKPLPCQPAYTEDY